MLISLQGQVAIHSWIDVKLLCMSVFYLFIYLFIYFILFYFILFFFLGAEHFEELVSMVKEHCLFKEALKLYPKSTEQHRVCIVQLSE